jgi:hypothetical protein
MFDACQMRRCVNVTIVDDVILENVESFDLYLERTSDLDSRITLDPAHGVLEFADNDVAAVGLERTFYNVSEGVGAMNVCAIVYSPIVPCPVNFSFDVSLSTNYDCSSANGSAVSSLNYSLSDTTLTFAACETKRCMSVSIVDDDTPGNVESFDVTLERTTDLDSRIALDPVNGILEITDNDGAAVCLENTFYQVSESGGMVEVCAILYGPNCPMNFAFDINLLTLDGSAVSPSDYGAMDTLLNFNELQMRSCVNMSIVDDAILEDDESFDVTLERTPDLDSRITLDDPSSAWST